MRHGFVARQLNQQDNRQRLMRQENQNRQAQRPENEILNERVHNVDELLLQLGPDEDDLGNLDDEFNRLREAKEAENPEIKSI